MLNGKLRNLRKNIIDFIFRMREKLDLSPQSAVTLSISISVYQIAISTLLPLTLKLPLLSTPLFSSYLLFSPTLWQTLQ